MNNLAALFIGQISLILLIDGLIINRTHIQQVPGNFEFGIDAGIVIGIQISGLPHDFGNFINRRAAGLNQALFITDQAAGIVIF